MTVVYDMVSGHLTWVEIGRTAYVFSGFLKQPETTAAGIKAVAMDMGPAYQKAVREYLPKADVIFNRFHVMQNYSKAMQNQRRIEFRKANRSDKELMKGTHYLLLRNADKLNEKQSEKLTGTMELNFIREHVRATGELVPDSGSVKYAVFEKVCKVSEEAPRGYLQLCEAQTHQRQNRGRKRPHWYDPKTSQRYQRHRVFQAQAIIASRQRFNILYGGRNFTHVTGEEP